MKKNLQSCNFYNLISCLFIVVLYVYCAPQTVQGLDSGEHVTNAYQLRISHPSGYPIYIFLFHSVLMLFKIKSVFYTASLINILVSISGIFLFLKNKNIVSSLLVINLALVPVYWRYSIIPDVHILHATLMILIIRNYIDDSEGALLKSSVLFGLACGNHLNIIFILPLFIHQILRAKKNRFLSVLIFFIMMTASYSLILIFNWKDFGSWGDFSTLKGFLTHVTRSEYGMIKLTAIDMESHYLDRIAFFCKLVFQNFFGNFIILFMVILNFKEINEKKKFLTLMFCLFLYLTLFFSLANINPFEENADVFERFLIHPLVLMTALGVYFFKFNKLNKWPMVAICCFNILFNISDGRKNNYYRDNSIIEDYAHNLLNSLPPNSLLFPVDDTTTFALYYAQSVQGVRKDVVVILPFLLSKSWYQQKLSLTHPHIQIKNSLIDTTTDKQDEGSNFIKYFLDYYPEIPVFISPYHYSSPAFENYSIKVDGLAIKLENSKKGKIRQTNCRSMKSFHFTHGEQSHHPKKDYDLTYTFLLNYSACDLIDGIAKFNQQDFLGAKVAFDKILMFNPNHTMAIHYNCLVEKALSHDTQECRMKMLDNLDTNYDYNHLLNKYAEKK